MSNNRSARLYDLRKKKGRSLSILVVGLLFGILGSCIGCTQDVSTKGIVYENELLGFSLEFPADWEGRYIIEEEEDSIFVFSKKVYENDGGGLLFSMIRQVGELITKEDMQQAPVDQQIILQGNGYTYFKRMPSDMQYPPDDEELSSEYEDMSEQVSHISDSISLLGDKKPEVMNEGFKVAGTSFFIVEIPSDWEIRAIDSLLCWDLYIGDNEVGEIALIPYKSEGPAEASALSDNMIREYLFDDDTSREIRIMLDSEDVDLVTTRKIKESLEFVDGPYNVVDLLSSADQYIAYGGERVFGRIEGFEMEGTDPVAIDVKVMNFVTPDDESPNGFRIEDLNQVKTYSLDFGVHVAPLIPPNYNTYGIYEMPLLDGAFIQDYEDCKDLFYDFIVGRDGQLKIMLGHYIP